MLAALILRWRVGAEFFGLDAPLRGWLRNLPFALRAGLSLFLCALPYIVIGCAVALIVKRRRAVSAMAVGGPTGFLYWLVRGAWERLTLPPVEEALQGDGLDTVSLFDPAMRFAPDWDQIVTVGLIELGWGVVGALLGVGLAWVLLRYKDELRSFGSSAWAWMKAHPLKTAAIPLALLLALFALAAYREHEAEQARLSRTPKVVLQFHLVDDTRQAGPEPDWTFRLPLSPERKRKQTRLPDDEVVKAKVANESGEVIYMSRKPYVEVRNSDIVKAKVEFGPTGFGVRVVLAREAVERLNWLFREHLDRRVAIVFGGKVVGAPVIAGEVRGPLILNAPSGREEEAREMALTLLGE